MPILTDGCIIEDWQQLLPNCQDAAPGLLDATEVNLRAAAAPGVSWSLESVSPSFLKGLFGARRTFLICKSQFFPEHHVCIGSWNYGTSLVAVWTLAFSRKISRRLRRAMHLTEDATHRNDVGQELTIFEKIDLQCFSSVTFAAVRQAVDALAKERELEYEPLERMGPSSQDQL